MIGLDFLKKYVVAIHWLHNASNHPLFKTSGSERHPVQDPEKWNCKNQYHENYALSSGTCPLGRIKEFPSGGRRHVIVREMHAFVNFI